MEGTMLSKPRREEKLSPGSYHIHFLKVNLIEIDSEVVLPEAREHS